MNNSALDQDCTVPLFAGIDPDESLATSFRVAMNKTRSDKSLFHKYEQIYSHIFKNQQISKLLEIGCYMLGSRRSSLYGWAELFPQSQILGADLHTNLIIDTDQISTFFVDQSKPELLKLLSSKVGKCNVIIDDASHIFELTISTFESLIENIEDGGVYVIEDIHLNQWDKHPEKQTVQQMIEWFEKSSYNWQMFQSDRDLFPNEVNDFGPFASHIMCIYK